jgi:hypothetical protein
MKINKIRCNFIISKNRSNSLIFIIDIHPFIKDEFTLFSNFHRIYIISGRLIRQLRLMQKKALITNHTLHSSQYKDKHIYKNNPKMSIK